MVARTAAPIFALAALLRLFGLADAVPLGDEYMQFYYALHFRALPAFLDAIRHNPGHFLIDPLGTWAMAGLGGSAATLRLPSLAWGLAAVAGAWALGSTGGNAKRGAACALLMAAAPMQVEWSRRADLYAGLAALSAWNGVFLLRLVERPQARLKYAAVSVLFILSNAYASATALIHGIFAARRGAFRAWAACWLAAGVVFAPWFLASTRMQMSRRWVHAWPGASGLLSYLFALPFELASRSEVAASGGAISVFLGLACLGFYGASAARWLRGKADSAVTLAHLTVLLGLCAVVTIDWSLDLYLAPRQTIWLAPFYFLAAADEAGRLLGRRAPLAAALAGAAGVFLCLGVASAERRLGAGADEAVRRVAESLRPGDALVFDDSLLAHGFLYHFDRSAFAAAPAFRAPPERIGFASVYFSGETPRGPAWRFRGSMEDLRIEAPEGRWP